MNDRPWSTGITPRGIVLGISCLLAIPPIGDMQPVLARESDTPTAARRLTAGGMTVDLRPVGSDFECTLRAPTAGWVAIGFNSRPGLTGTNLIMAAVLPDGRVELSDRFIFGPGDHRAIGPPKAGSGSLKLISGREEARAAGIYTEIRFRVALRPADRYHHDLTRRELYLLMAYSQADDFGHHSMMRTERKL
jgi:hypothetical protein